MARFNQLKSVLKEEAPNEIVANPYTQPKEQKSAIEAGLRGAAQGATMGFADEIAGAAGAIASVPKSFKEAREAYNKERDASRKEFKQAKEDQPTAYNVGDVAGSIGSMAIPGMSSLQGVKQAAMLGGLSGLGRSEEESPAGIAGDVALGGALGAGVGKLAQTNRFKSLLAKMKPTSKKSAEEEFRKTLNPDLYELQTTGKMSPKLKAQVDNVGKEAEAALTAEQKEFQKQMEATAKEAGMSVEEYTKQRQQAVLDNIRRIGSVNSEDPTLILEPLKKAQ